MNKIIVGLLFALPVLVQAQSPQTEGDPTETVKVFRFAIDAEIDPRMTRRVTESLADAKESEADYVLVDMNSFGGAVNDADKIRNMLLDFDKPVWVYVDQNAASAGALISLACDSIFMAPGSSMGAATVVTGQGEAAPDKYQSYMRSIMRSTAERQGRDPKTAEAMVDQTLDLDSLAPAGQVLTLTAKEALSRGFCEAIVSDTDQLLQHNGIDPAQVEFVEYTTTWVDVVISFVLNPVVSGLLILIFIGGLYFELQSPGIGFPIIASGVALITYLVPYYLTGLAANWEIALFAVGLVLLVLEVFVIPGFGIAGIAGLICSLGAVVLVMVDNVVFDFTFVDFEDLIVAISTAMVGLLGGVVLMLLGGFRLAQTNLMARVAVMDVQSHQEGYTVGFREESMVGKEGVCITPLRPSGKVEIEDDVYSAYIESGHVEKGATVRVVRHANANLVVRLVKK